MSTLALAWLAEAAVLGDELVVWLSNSKVLRRVIDALAFLLEETLQAGPALEAAHVPLSQSVVTEGERNALIDVWKAQNNPSKTSGIVLKQPPAIPLPLKSREPDPGWSAPRLFIFAALSLLLLVTLGLLLAR
jgi:hypothetical protein